MAYRPEAYDTLPSLFEAAAAFQAKGARKHLETDIRQLFLDFNVHQRYGVSLLHKHFSIEATQRLVDCHHTATPWTCGDRSTSTFEKYEGHIVPRSYRFYENGTSPYEFAFRAEASAPDDADFVRELGDLFEKLDLANLLGLRVLGDRDSELKVEVTEGKASIMLAPGAVPDSELIEALWIFGLDDDDRCHCREVCWPTKKPDGTDNHLKDHSCG